MTSISGVYPLTLEQATDLLIDLKLSPYTTFLVPSRWRMFALSDLSTATLFRLTFDADHIPTTDPNEYVMCVREGIEIDRWLAACGGAFEEVELTAVGFGSAEDKTGFETRL